MLAEIAGLNTHPFTEEELARAKDNILNSFLFRYDTRDKVLAERVRSSSTATPPTTWRPTKPRLEKVTLADLNRVADKYVHPEKLCVLVVGNGTRDQARPRRTEPRPDSSHRHHHPGHRLHSLERYARARVATVDQLCESVLHFILAPGSGRPKYPRPGDRRRPACPIETAAASRSR